MATQAVLIPQDVTSDTTWRAWGLGFHNALAALGTVVQTSDTGQANWATATRSAGAYEIWRFNDTLQSTAPAFWKFSFLNAGTNCRVQIELASGTDGAGNLTGRIGSLFNHDLSNDTANAQQYYFSSTPSRLTVWMEADALHNQGVNGALFTIERSRDNTGTELGSGIMLWIIRNGGAAGCTWIAGSATAVPAALNFSSFQHTCIWAGVPSYIAATGQVTAFALNCIGTNYQVQNPPLGILAYWTTDLALGTPLPLVRLYGADRQYINTGANPAGATIDTTANCKFMMLYE